MTCINDHQKKNQRKIIRNGGERWFWVVENGINWCWSSWNEKWEPNTASTARKEKLLLNLDSVSQTQKKNHLNSSKDGFKRKEIINTRIAKIIERWRIGHTGT
jgi:hypothetical protein